MIRRTQEYARLFKATAIRDRKMEALGKAKVGKAIFMGPVKTEFIDLFDTAKIHLDPLLGQSIACLLAVITQVAGVLSRFLRSCKAGFQGPNVIRFPIIEDLLSISDGAEDSLLFGPQVGALSCNVRIPIILAIRTIEGSKDRLQGIVIFHLHRINLVIMTLRTLDSERTESIHSRGDHIITVQMPRNLAIDLLLGDLGMPNEIPWPGGEKARGHDPINSVRIQSIARDLFFDELCVGLVFIEGADNIVALRPRMSLCLSLS